MLREQLGASVVFLRQRAVHGEGLTICSSYMLLRKSILCTSPYVHPMYFFDGWGSEVGQLCWAKDGEHTAEALGHCLA